MAGDHMLPANSAPYERSISLSQERILDVDMDVIRRSVLANLSPEPLLPWLAWDRSVDEYVDSWPVANRRAAIHGSFPYHKVKGTPGGLKRALASLDYATTVTEWFQYGGAPFRFRIRIVKDGNSSLTRAEMQALKRLIYAAKNVRSFLDRIETHVTHQAPGPYVAAWGARRVRTVTIYPEAA